MRNNFIHILFLTFFCFSLTAQQKVSRKFKQIGGDAGLSNNWVRAIHQDDLGFIWLGTVDGLNRFDGYECKTYRPTNENGIVYGNIAINHISNKSKNELWLSSSNGLYVYKNNQIENFKNTPYTTYRAAVNQNDSITWAGGIGGLLKINQYSNTVENLGKDASHPLFKTPIYSIFKDSKNNFWFGSTGVIIKYDPINNVFEKYTSFLGINTNTKKDILAITEDKTGSIWIGFGQNGVFYYNPKSETKSFTKFDDGAIIGLHVDRENQLWIGRASSKGLKVVDLNDTNSIKNSHIYLHEVNNSKSISDNSIFSIYEDMIGDMWIGTFGGGVNYTTKREKKIHTLSLGIDKDSSIQNNLVNCILEEKDYLWIGTVGGLERIDKKTNIFTRYTYNPNDSRSISRDPILSLCKDHQGNLWVGTWDGGLNRYNYKTSNFTRYPSSSKKGAIHSDHVQSILNDSKNRLWVATSGGGLYQYNYTNDTFKHYSHDPKDPNSISTNYVNQLVETSDNEILFSSNHAINFFNPNKDKFTRHVFNTGKFDEKKSIICSFIDSKERIWVGTNIGLYIFDRNEKKYNAFNPDNLISNLSVMSIIEDNEQHIWIGTNKGLYKIEPSTNKIKQFTTQDGLTANDFKAKSAYKNKQGTLYFGTSKGLSYFNPTELFKNQIAPTIAITSFNVLESKPNENNQFQSILENPNTENKITLNHNQSSFVISFTGLNYLHPEKNNYQYQLEGYDKVWVNASKNRTATYTNVAPGNYTFKILGTNNDGKWSATPKTLSIHIKAPWYKTDLFITLLGILLLLSPLIFYIARFSIYKKQRRLLEKNVEIRTKELTKANNLLHEKSIEITQKNEELGAHRNHLEQLVKDRTEELYRAKLKAEESDRLKSAFVANMSHEIRTPMNAIYGFSGMLNEVNVTKEERAEYVKIINSSCDSLLVLIDDILDISILDAQGIQLKLQPINLYKFLKEIEKIYKQKETPELSLNYESIKAHQTIVINTDVVRLKQILSNLLNNAFKFTEKGEVNFGFTYEDDLVTFYVEDTGIGIDSKDINSIFESFSKGSNNFDKVYRGTGIGLSISKKLVDTFNGEIWVKSTINVGSTFYVEIPTNI